MDPELRAFRQVLPSKHLLRSAYRVSRLVDESEEEVRGLRQAYNSVPTDGLFDQDAFRRGEQLLYQAGLVELDDDRIRARRQLRVVRGLEEEEACLALLRLLLQATPPLWLSNAVGLEGIREPYIPDYVNRQLEELFPDQEIRAVFLMGLGTVDKKARDELGQRGEEAVVAACRAQRLDAGHKDLVGQVQQVSTLSDGFGYDVSAPCPTGPAHHLEVKTVGHPGDRLTLHLSRHQIQVGICDPSWRVVVCQRIQDTIQVVGWSTSDMLTPHLPEDRNMEVAAPIKARWEQVEVRIDRSLLRSGLPPLEETS